MRSGVARFSWEQTGEVLAELLARHEMVSDGAGFVTRDEAGDLIARFTPPLVQRVQNPDTSPQGYLADLPGELGTHLVLLLQAGAAALGLWQRGALVHHKVIKKYVVRGSGRAQPTHLKTRGKSRYGSRLRLQNHRKLLTEVNETLCSWVADVPDMDERFYSCPVRTWPELFGSKPPPPFEREGFAKIPLDVHVPSFEELQRVYRELCRGRVEVADVRG